VKAKRAPIVAVKMQPRGAGRRGAARGYGRGSGRDHVWRRIEDGDVQNQRGGRNIEEANMKEGGDTLNQGNPSPWESQVNRSEEKNEDSWKGNPHPMGEDGPKDSHVKKEVTRSFNLDRSGCAFCHFKNHLTKDCRHRFPCDICGCDDHVVFDCKKCLPWNFGPELCATQVEDQSFFYIEEKVDNRMIKEKSSTAIITVVQGNVSEKQIELEFMNMLGKNLWRWSARSVGDNKFVMRFPDPKMIGDLGYFRPLGMRTAKAQITIDPWTPAVNAKGCLQKGWFRISGIPMEQRSLVTIAKVGGLVGKVIEIDERTRLRNEYVRARIACRDVTVVPGVVEGSLGLFLYDFFFEREIHSEEDEQFLETGIRIDDSNQKVAKRYKYEGKMQKDKKVDYGNLEDGNIKQHDECNRKSQSYTYQMQGLDKNVSKGKNVGAEEGKTGKSYSSCSGEEKNKVHITDSKEDDDSDLLGEELMAMKNRGSGSNSHTMWNIQADSLDNLNSRSVSQTKTSKCSAIIEELDTNEKGVDNSEELFSGTQGSSIVNVSQEEGEDLSDQRKKIDGVIFHEDNQKFMPSPIPVRRVSERLKKDMGIRIEEKNRRMAVKRNLEGNSCIPEPNFSCLASKEIIDISKKMGVNINEQNMESIELLKEMELARQCLGQKKTEILQKKEVDNMVKRNDEYFGSQVNEESETDDFILVQSRKKKRIQKRNSERLQKQGTRKSWPQQKNQKHWENPKKC
jgi:hypothetical protein